MAQTLRSKMHWQTESGQILDDDRRYILLRVDVLMGIFTRLAPETRKEALAAFGQAVYESGGKSAKAYFQELGNDGPRLLQTMEDYSAELGWGKWSFKQNGDTSLQLTVHNSPFAAGFGSSTTPVCHAIVGMLTTVGELVLQDSVSAQETRCAAQGHSHCEFHICPL